VKIKVVEPEAEGDNDSTLACHKTEYEKVKAQWKRSDMMALMIMNHSINHVIRGALPKKISNGEVIAALIDSIVKGHGTKGPSQENFKP
jgi:hypothetical protein